MEPIPIVEELFVVAIQVVCRQLDLSGPPTMDLSPVDGLCHSSESLIGIIWSLSVQRPDGEHDQPLGALDTWSHREH